MIGDNYLGRFLNGVSHVDLNFIKLPPHFDGVNEPANADYEALLPGFGTLPPCFQGVIKFATASLLFHSDFVRSYFSPSHPIIMSMFYQSDFISRFKNFVVTTGEKSGLVSSGVPPHLNMHYDLKKLQNQNDELNLKLDTQHKFIIDLLKLMPEQVVNEIVKNNLTINGVVSKSYFDQMKIDILDAVSNISTSNNSVHVIQSIEPPSTPLTISLGNKMYPVVKWTYDSAFHIIDQNFIYPLCTIELVFLCYFFGINGSVPFKSSYFSKDIVLLSKYNKNNSSNNYSKSCQVIKRITDIILSEKLVTNLNELQEMGSVEAMKLFQMVYDKFLMKLYKVDNVVNLKLKCRDKCKLKYTTAYDLLQNIKD